MGTLIAAPVLLIGGVFVGAIHDVPAAAFITGGGLLGGLLGVVFLLVGEATGAVKSGEAAVAHMIKDQYGLDEAEIAQLTESLRQ